MRRSIFAAVAWLGLALFGGEAAAGMPPVETFRLPNGLEVVLQQDATLPRVAVNVWYHVGAKDDPPARSGFAHLFEHMMFQGSRHVGEDMFLKHLDRVGAVDHDGTTDVDRTNFFESVPPEALALALWLESDRMGFLLDHVNERTFANQREVVKNERRERVETAPFGNVWEILYAAMYPAGHPYHRGVLGSWSDLESATVEDVRAFFRAHYAPSNATVTLVGALPADTRELVTRYFGSLPSAPRPPAKPVPAVTLTRETWIDVEAEVELGRVAVAWSTPAFFTKGEAELDVVAQILAGGEASRLVRRLVRERRLVQRVEVAQESADLGSLFNASMVLEAGASSAAVVDALDEELAQLANAGPSDDEVQRAKRVLVTSLTKRMDAPAGRADRLQQYAAHAAEVPSLEADVARYERVSVASIRDAVRKYLGRGRIVVNGRPTKGAPIAGRVVKTEVR